ncbi:MAG TPA: CBS domain-containing protein [Chloroflexi bacterium]|nr:CBS domain-containing protein [Chloroflexota bacterium]
MNVCNAMKHNVISATPEMTVLEAARLIVRHKVGALPVVGDDKQLVGLLTIGNILDIFIPNYFDQMENMQFVHDFGALEDFLPKDVPEIGSKTLQTLMRPPISVSEDESILRAATRMIRHEMVDLPVINNAGQLAGLVSHVDIGTRFLQKWMEARGGTLE